MLIFRKPIRHVVWAMLLLAMPLHDADATTYLARIDVMADSNGAVVFRFRSNLGLEAAVNIFAVVGQVNGKYDYQKPAWLLARPPGSYQRLSEIRYGDVVDGFQIKEARQLVEGQRYRALMSGAGISESIDFELVSCSGKKAIRILKTQ